MKKDRFFFDTEFIELGYRYPLSLISIGIVSEDGRELYKQLVDTTWASADPWVWENVISKLTTCLNDNPEIDQNEHLLRTLGVGPNGICTKPDCPWAGRLGLARDIIKFCSVGSNPEFWAYFADYDWVLLCQLFGRMIDMPPGFPHMCMDIRQYQKQLRIGELPSQDEGVKHNALDDARWNLKAWQFLKEAEQKGRYSGGRY